MKNIKNMKNMKKIWKKYEEYKSLKHMLLTTLLFIDMKFFCYLWLFIQRQDEFLSATGWITNIRPSQKFCMSVSLNKLS